MFEGLTINGIPLKLFLEYYENNRSRRTYKKRYSIKIIKDNLIDYLMFYTPFYEKENFSNIEIINYLNDNDISIIKDFFLGQGDYESKPVFSENNFSSTEVYLKVLDIIKNISSMEIAKETNKIQDEIVIANFPSGKEFLILKEFKIGESLYRFSNFSEYLPDDPTEIFTRASSSVIDEGSSLKFDLEKNGEEDNFDRDLKKSC